MRCFYPYTSSPRAMSFERAVRRAQIFFLRSTAMAAALGWHLRASISLPGLVDRHTSFSVPAGGSQSASLRWLVARGTLQ